MQYAIVNGQLIDAKQASIHIGDRGFRYGDGVFETLALVDGVPYQFDWHMRRLAAGLKAIRIDFPVQTVYEQARRLLKENKARAGLLRIQVTRGSGSRGYLPDAANASGPTLVIETVLQPPAPPEPVALWLSSHTKISSGALPLQYKLCQGLHSTLARLEADENHCFDALVLNNDGDVCETSSANIFWLKNNRLYTPALACGMVEGATRAALMRLTPVQEVRAELPALKEAEAVFITNVAWTAVAVNRLLPKNLRWDSAAAAQRFRAMLSEDRQREAKSLHTQWLNIRAS